MRIGELSRRTGVSERSLRHYESKGLIHAVRAANGYRHYPPAAVERIGSIRRFLACGFSTDEIREFVPCFEEPDADQACPFGVRRHLEKLRQVDALIAALETQRRVLVDRLAQFGLPIPTGTGDIADGPYRAGSAAHSRHGLDRRGRVRPRPSSHADR